MAGSEQEQAVLTEHALEQALDEAIRALTVLDSPMLVELANLCAVWSTESLQTPLSEQQRANLQAKLILLGGLLRNTEVSLHLLGVPLGPSWAAQPNWTSESTFAHAHRGL